MEIYWLVYCLQGFNKSHAPGGCHCSILIWPLSIFLSVLITWRTVTLYWNVYIFKSNVIWDQHMTNFYSRNSSRQWLPLKVWYFYRLHCLYGEGFIHIIGSEAKYNKFEAGWWCILERSTENSTGGEGRLYSNENYHESK